MMKNYKTAVTVTCDTGKYWVSEINTDIEGAKAYYTGKTFVTENDVTGEEKEHNVIRVEAYILFYTKAAWAAVHSDFKYCLDGFIFTMYDGKTVAVEVQA
jgi:hypothetical protein